MNGTAFLLGFLSTLATVTFGIIMYLIVWLLSLGEWRMNGIEQLVVVAMFCFTAMVITGLITNSFDKRSALRCRR